MKATAWVLAALTLLPCSAFAASDYQYYSVKPGDTLEALSDHFESNVNELCRMNGNLKPLTPLTPGVILMVPLPPPPISTYHFKPTQYRHAAPEEAGQVEHPRSHGAASGGLTPDEAEAIYDTVVLPVARGIVAPIAYASQSIGLPGSQNVVTSSSGDRVYIPTAPPRHKAEPAPEESHARHSLSSRRAQRTQGLLKTALRFMGVPYVWGGESPTGMDCSGFIQRVFTMNGVSVPRTADLQFEVGQKVPNGEEQPGDCVFFETYCPGASHVGIYLGRHQFVHASSTAGHVTIGDLRLPRFQRCYLGAKRIL